MNQPFISIGIPIYNAEKYLALAIQSVINQSYQNWELILIDDGSIDNSLQIAKSFEAKDKRIRVISDGQNKKLPYRLNQIIDEARYDYIARMDSDDLMHPNRLETQIKFLRENTKYDLVSTGVVSINQDNIAYGYRGVDSIYSKLDESTRTFNIVHPTILARTTWYKRNKYSTEYPRCEDFELWCRTASKNDLKLAILPDLLYYYREGGVLESDKLINSYNQGLHIRKKYFGKPTIKDRLRVEAKIILVKNLERMGLLQIIAKHRNKSKPCPDILQTHQNIIDRLVYNKA